MSEQKLTSISVTEYNKQTFASNRLNLKETRLKKVYRMILEEKSGNLLDIGCGNGDFSSLFIKAGWEPYGIDLDAANIEQAKVIGVKASVCDITKGLPFEDNFFECVLAGEVIEHLIDTDFLIKEIFRVVRAGGCVIITTPNMVSFENRIRILLGIYPIWVNYRLEGVGHVRAYTPKVLKKQLMEHGFKIEKHKGNWVPFIPQRFINDIKWPWLSITGDLFPNLSMDIIIKARKPND